MSTTRSTPGGFADLDSKEWRTNNSTIQEKINNITSTVKNIIDTSLDHDDDNNNQNASDEENENNDEDERAERPKPTANKPVADFKLGKPVESSSKVKSNEKAASKSPIKLKTNLASKQSSKSEEVDEFGDFVSHRVESGSTGATTATNSDFLLSFDNMNVKEPSAAAKPLSPPKAPTKNVDDLFAIDDGFDANPTHSTVTGPNNDDLFNVFSSKPVTQTPIQQSIPSSFTMPNLQYAVRFFFALF
jgi:hypothetical protein